VSIELRRVRIPSGDADLSALLYLPKRTARHPAAVLSHGYTAGKESLDLLAAYLCIRGYPVITFDARGHKLGGSIGAVSAVSQLIEDLKHVADFARETFSSARAALIGHSMGGLLSLALAADYSATAGVCVIAAGPEPTRSFATVVGAAMLNQRSSYVEGIPASRFIRELETLAQSIPPILSVPVQFLAAKNDVLVSSDKMAAYMHRTAPLGTFVEIEGGHLDAPDRGRGSVAAWLDTLHEQLQAAQQ
jgi:alpha-beta hydrolase superfamily lysophospholipase